MSTGNARRLARIDRQRCIGCARCIDACPFDAIIGAPQRMHTVIDESCIGCGLCVPPCPVDCIELVVAHPPAPLTRREAIEARTRRARRDARLAREAEAPVAPAFDRQAMIAAAMLRAQARRSGPQQPAGEAAER